MSQESQVVLFGAGQVGEIILQQALKEGYHLIAVDANKSRLDSLKTKYPTIETAVVDLTEDTRIKELTKDTDLAFSTMPGAIGSTVLKSIIQYSKPGSKIVDVAFSLGSNAELNQLTQEKNITVVEQAGLAPGLLEIILGDHRRRMKVKKIITASCGLSIPASHQPQGHDPYFEIGGIIDLYRKAEIVNRGRIEILPALTEAFRTTIPEYFGAHRELVAFFAPGLRFAPEIITELDFAADLILRDIAHFDEMQKLRDLGYLDEKIITINAEINGERVKVQIPTIELTKAVFMNNWKFPEKGIKNGTFIQIDVGGILPNYQIQNEEHIMFNSSIAPVNSLSLMTGSVTFAVGRIALENRLKLNPGIHPPDDVGAQGHLEEILIHLQNQGIIYQHKTG